MPKPNPKDDQNKLLNLEEIDYDKHLEAREARVTRSTRMHGGKNIATIKLISKGKTVATYTRTSIPASKAGVSPEHSEVAVWSAAWKGHGTELKNGNVKIQCVYTERAPCKIGPGMRNCYGFLVDILEKYGEKGLDTPVYYSYPYPTDYDTELSIRILSIGANVFNDYSAEQQAELNEALPNLGKVLGMLDINNLIDPTLEHWDDERADEILGDDEVGDNGMDVDGPIWSVDDAQNISQNDAAMTGVAHVVYSLYRDDAIKQLKARDPKKGKNKPGS